MTIPFRKKHSKSSIFSLFTGNLYSAGVRFDNFLANREPQARTLRRGGEKWNENFTQILFLNSRSVILHNDPDISRQVRVGLNSNRQAPLPTIHRTGFKSLNAVLDQIQKDL